MNWLKRILLGDEKSQIGKLINRLANKEELLSSLESKKDTMQEDNPFVGRLGTMMGGGSPPDGLDSAMGAAEERLTELSNEILRTEREIAGLKTRLLQVTEQDFNTSSEWNEWLNNTYGNG
jgi:hypothetical protein